YCSDPLTSNLYDKTCYCVLPRDSCLGGVQTGEFKCNPDGWLFECNELNVFEFVEECEFGCEDGMCLEFYGEDPYPLIINYPLIILVAIGIIFVIIFIVILTRSKR
ncbi:unnamed protein product, partial [marine sediment metagenome]